MQTLESDIVIVGGGPAGAALACNLRDSGLRIVLADQNKQIPRVARGDHMAPCTVRMLDRLGALPNLMKRGAVKVTRWRATGPEGEMIAEIPTRMTAPPPHDYILSLHHPLIEEALLETATEGDAVQVLRGLRVNALVRNDAGAVTGITGVRGGDQVRVNARLVAGCDGARSVVRQAAGIPSDLYTYPYEYLMLTCSRSARQPEGMNLEVWGREGFYAFYPLPDGLVRCPIQAGPGELARWREIGLARMFEELSQRFPLFSDMVLHDEQIYTYKIVSHHAETYVADGLVLIGDAACCTSPYYGMGMTMAMRGAYHAGALVRELLANHSAPTAAALEPYERRCRNYNQFVVTASESFGRVAASKLETAADIQKALQTSTALDPDVMAVIYADYDAPPPQDTDPVQVSRFIAGIRGAAEMKSTALLDGFGFIEAPRWHAGRLWLVDYFAGQVFTLDDSGRRRKIADVPGTPGGLGFLPNGTPLVVSQTQFKLYCIGTDGVLYEYADLSGHARGGLNELLVTAGGDAYVGHFGFDFFGGGDPAPASLLLVRPGGRVRVVAEDMTFPNGMAITADGRTLIVAETFLGRLTAFDVQPDGSLSGRRTWAELPGYTPDGICLDAEGAAWVGNPLASAFIRVRQGGAISHRVPTGERWAVACVLGGAQRRTLYCLTAETSLAAMPRGDSRAFVETVEVEVPGAGLP